jgi:hypothetical protein
MLFERDEIIQNCKFGVQPYRADAAVLVLAPGQLILQFIPQYTLACFNASVVTQEGCALCILRVPCRCTFRALHYNYYANIAHCAPTTQITEPMAYAVNLILLHKYFNTSEFLGDHTQLLSALPKVLMPNISFHLTEVDRKLGLMQQTIIDLDTVAQASLNQSQLFLSVADQLTQNFEALKFDVPDLMQTVLHALTFLNPVLTVLSLLGFLYLFFRLRVLSTAAFLFTGAHAIPDEATASSTTSNKRIWQPAAWLTTRAPPPTFSEVPFAFNPFTLANWQSIEFSDDSFKKSVITALIFISLFFVIICCGRCFRICLPCLRMLKHRIPQGLPLVQSSVSFTIMLAISNAEHSYLIDLLQVPYCVPDYLFQATQFVTRIAVSDNYFLPRLMIEWPEFRVQHKCARLEFKLPASIRIAPTQARGIRKILADRHSVLFYLRDYHEHICLMPLQETIWAMQPNPRDTVVTVSERPPLYPNLVEVTRL